MLTPTGVTRAAYINAIKADAITHARLVFTTQGITLDDQDIDITMGLEMDDILNGDTDMTFGKAVMKQLRVGILNSSRVSNLIWTDEFRLDIGVEISGSTKWVTVGTFIGEKPRNITNVSIIEYTANDRMRKFDVLVDEFWASLTFPKTLAGIYHALCDYIGVGYNDGDGISATLNRSFASAPAELQGYTCRDLLAWIAEACGCYARIDSTGVCKLVWFADFHTEAVFTQDDIFHIATADLNSGLTWDEFDQYTWYNADKLTWNDVCGYEETYGLDSLQVKQLGDGVDVNYPQFIGGNVYLIVENPFLSVETYSDITTYIKPIWDRLAAFGGYLPINVDCIGNWLVETGDIISVQIDDTHTISVPLFCRRLVWRGACRDMYETTGNLVREEVVVGGLSTRDKLISRNNIRLVAKDLYYGLQSGVEITPDGVEVSGGKYVDIKSGSSLTLESGGNVDVKSGGNVDVKSGGKIDIKSGGSVDIESGGNVNVKSGGTLAVETGGNIDINASGNLKLSGSTVEIKSGSTFDVDSNNMIIDSDRGIVVTKTSSDIPGYMQTVLIGTYQTSMQSEPFLFRIAPGISYHWQGPTSYNVNLSLDDNISDTDYKRSMRIRYDYDERTFFGTTDFYNILKIDGEKRNKTTDVSETSNPILDAYRLYSAYAEITELKATRINYYNLVQSSSRDIKNNIQPMEPVGEKLDRLQPVTFVYDDDPEEKERAGLIYEDTVEVMPEICTGDESNKAISYMELVPMLLKEIQDLRARVKALEEREGGQ